MDNFCGGHSNSSSTCPNLTHSVRSRSLMPRYLILKCSSTCVNQLCSRLFAIPRDGSNNGKNADIHQSVENSEEQLSITIKQGKAVCKYICYR